MADATVIPVDQPDYDSGGLSVPPLDTTFFSQYLLGDNDDDHDHLHTLGSDNQNDVVLDDFDFDFDFSFDELLPSDDLHDLLFSPNYDDAAADVSNSNYSPEHELGQIIPKDAAADHSSNLSSSSSSPGSNGSNCAAKGLSDCPSPNVSQESNNCAAPVQSVSFGKNIFKLENPASNCVTSSAVLKRKKVDEDLVCDNKPRTSKHKGTGFNVESDNSNGNSEGSLNVEEEKRRARLIRNRESAQLSRQRKKHYVEELEGKVRTMHSTIQDLNAKISYFMAENATLRQQMGGGAVPAPPTAGMYPPAPMMYPWMPNVPPYMVKPHGSQVPLVPIPKLKPQQPAQPPKASKKEEGKKNEGTKVESKKKEGTRTKKVAGVSFLGLLFFIMLFGGLVPMVNVRYGGVREAWSDGKSYIGGGFHEKHHGRVLMVNGTECGGRRDFIGNGGVHCGKPSTDEFLQSGNGSEPLVASLYVPRNDKLVKIDGNLIINSVLASEKAMSSHGRGGAETGLAVHGDLAPVVPVTGLGMNDPRHSHLRALGSGSSADKDNMKPTTTDSRLQQWFQEGLAGPMLSSSMCTQVFQFDVSSASASGAILPATATTSRNISQEKNHNSTHHTKGTNRRILRSLPIPLSESSHNISREHERINTQKDNLRGNYSVSPMVVSVLVDPREAVDADVDGVIRKKSLSRIFVVVLIDSVKYVTYSCMLPFMGSTHVVTA